MNTRTAILTLVAGSSLVLGASTANARIIEGNGLTAPAGVSASSHYSAVALKALDLRWEAIAKAYRQQHSGNVGTFSRPDDRSGSRGA
jgi:hypothetical protein